VATVLRSLAETTGVDVTALLGANGGAAMGGALTTGGRS
jgi:hypothetical protein